MAVLLRRVAKASADAECEGHAAWEVYVDRQSIGLVWEGADWWVAVLSATDDAAEWQMDGLSSRDEAVGELLSMHDLDSNPPGGWPPGSFS